MSHYSIKDGRGSGQLAQVDTEGRMHTYATSEPEELHANRLNADHYISYVDITPTADGDYFYYIKNNNTLDMIISWYRIWTASSAEAIDLIRNPVGTPTGTTNLTPVNMNFGSNKTATADVYEGVDLGGLSGGTTLDRLRISGDGKDVVDSYQGGIILPQGSVLACTVVNGAIPVEFTCSFYYTQLDVT